MDISNAINLALALNNAHNTSVLATWLFIYPTTESIGNISAFLRDPPIDADTESLAASIRNKYPNGIAPPR